MSRVGLIILCAAATLIVAACGSPKRVTYVDPNGKDDSTPAASGGEPFIRHGAAALERSRSCIAIRSALSAARALAVDSPHEAGSVIDVAVRDFLPMIDARGRSVAPIPAQQLRTGLQRLVNSPPNDITTYNQLVRQVTDDYLKRTCDAVVPLSARQDISFRAGMLVESLQDAATAYEEAFDGDTAKVSDIAAYRRAYGLLIDASTRQIESVPQDARPRIQSAIERIYRSATAGPTPAKSPHDPQNISAKLNAIADDVAYSAHIDTTYPSPDSSAPDQLRTLKRSLASAVEAYERGEPHDARRRVQKAIVSNFEESSSSVASISPTLLSDIERGLFVSLPTTIKTGGDFAAAAGEVDSLIDEAISLIEEELELLREES